MSGPRHARDTKLNHIGLDENEKIINIFGLWCLFISLITGPLWMFAMLIVNAMYKCNNTFDAHRSIYDQTGKIWSKVWLSLINSYPIISGNVDVITTTSKNIGPCLYVANHSSWIDIPILCTVLDPAFKFIAKGELRSVPCIGQQLDGVRSFFFFKNNLLFINVQKC
jgi:1-acyl-sn-glycerol-3-phosphate acyltransferase